MLSSISRDIFISVWIDSTNWIIGRRSCLRFDSWKPCQTTKEVLFTSLLWLMRKATMTIFEFIIVNNCEWVGSKQWLSIHMLFLVDCLRQFWVVLPLQWFFAFEFWAGNCFVCFLHLSCCKLAWWWWKDWGRE
jgi:hypothetical protein